MTDQEAFEAALNERPNDWALRAVYADWLEEHEQGELAAAITSVVAVAPDNTSASNSLAAGMELELFQRIYSSKVPTNGLNRALE